MTPEQEKQWRELKYKSLNEFIESGALATNMCPDFLRDSYFKAGFKYCVKKAQEKIDALISQNNKLSDFCNEFVYGEENPQYYSMMIDKLKERDKEISQLKEELKRERSAVDYYANRDIWSCHFSRHQDVIPYSDCDARNDDKNPALMKTVYGGKLARQTQQQRKVEL